LLNIDYVYVNIIVRHGLWVAFRESLIKQLKENIFSLSYPFTHVDLKNIPSKYGHGVFRIISQNLDLKAGKILVFRAHLGYFCQKFEEIGFDCYAFESDKKVIDILTKLKRAERKNFKIIENIMEDYTNVPKDIDIVIATGKISDLRRDFRSKKAFFNRMNVKVAFLHLHSNNSNSNEKLLEEIANNYILNNWEQIGSADDRTPIYRLYSS